MGLRRWFKRKFGKKQDLVAQAPAKKYVPPPDMLTKSICESMEQWPWEWKETGTEMVTHKNGMRLKKDHGTGWAALCGTEISIILPKKHVPSVTNQARILEALKEVTSYWELKDREDAKVSMAQREAKSMNDWKHLRDFAQKTLGSDAGSKP